MAVVNQVVILGASIMDASFNLSIYDPGSAGSPTVTSGFFRTAMFNLGFDVGQRCYAVAGAPIAAVQNQANDLIANTPLLDRPTTLVVIHAGGNDNSANGPFPGWTPQEIADFTNGLTNLVNSLLSTGFRVALGSLTRRAAGATDSADVNENLIYPIIQSLTPDYWDNSISRPVLDFYRFSEEIDADIGFYSSGDSIHPNVPASRELTVKVASAISTIDQPTPSQDATIYNFGCIAQLPNAIARNFTPNSNFFNASGIVDNTQIIDSYTATPLIGGTLTFDYSGANSTGVVADGNLMPNATYWRCVRNYVFGNPDVLNTITVTLPGFEDRPCTIIVTGTRAASGTRESTFTADTSATINATSSEPEVGVFTGTVDSGGVLTISHTHSTFGYLSGLTIILPTPPTPPPSGGGGGTPFRAELAKEVVSDMAQDMIAPNPV